MYAVRLRDLTKNFSVSFWSPRLFRGLPHVVLDLSADEVLKDLRPNSAVKTTTLRLLMELIYPRTAVPIATTGHSYLLDSRGKIATVSAQSPLFPLLNGPPSTNSR